MAEADMHKVNVPRENTSDDTAVLVEWHKKSGSVVHKGEHVASMETSKTSFDVDAPADGLLYYRELEGAEIAVGGLLAVVTSDPSFTFKDSPTAGSATVEPVRGQPRFSKSVLSMIEEHGLDTSLFSHLSLVRKKDVP